MAIIIAGLGCEGSQGPAGPEGPQGEQGLEGAEGPPGTANVVYSDWVAISDLETSVDTVVLDRNYRKYDIPAPELTQEIMDQGAILVYYRLNEVALQLPITFGGPNSIYITYSPFQAGVISILSQRLDNTALGLNQNSEFRYILIPGGVAADQSMLPDLSDYDAVLRHYGIDP
ncbi:MAG TPA: hypothetical protein VK966_04390 [Longimicrobiales bacterium]|nr:hypothetical protein [Longimicrobiales bacterium]